MASVIACPKCQTRLKLSKLPTEATRIQCPTCKHAFAISPKEGGEFQSGPPRTSPKTQAQRVAPGRPPLPRTQDEASSGGGKRTAIGILIAILLLAGGGITAYVLTRPSPEKKPEEVAQGDGKDKDHDQSKDKKEEGGTSGKKVEKKKDDPAKKRLELLTRAREHAKKKEFKEALFDYKKLLSKHPKDKEGRAGMQQVHDDLLARAQDSAKNNQFEDALADFILLAEFYPDDDDAKTGQRQAQARLDAENADRQAKKVEEKRKGELAELLTRGKELLEKKNYAKAMTVFEDALAKAPGNAEAIKGVNSAREGQTREELTRKYKGFMDSARDHLAAGRYLEAIKDASAAQQVMPTDPDTVADAVALRQQAEKKLDMIKDGENRKKAYDGVMAQAMLGMQNRLYAQAAQAYAFALKLFPDDIPAKTGLADAQLKHKQLVLELQAIQERFQVLMNQGDFAMQAGLFVDAVNFYGGAVRLIPTDQQAQAKLLGAQQAVNRVVAYRTAMERGRNAMFFKQYRDAMLAYNDALLVAPTDPFALAGREDARRFLIGTLTTKQYVDAKLKQAALLRNQQKWAQANQVLSDLTKFLAADDPAQNEVRFVAAMAKGEAAMKANRFGEAASAYIEAGRSIPDDPFAKQGYDDATRLGLALYEKSMVRGKTALDAKNFPEAVAGYTDAVNSLSDDPLAEKGNQLDLAKTGLKAAQEQGTVRFNQSIAQAKLAMDAKNYPSALASYIEALRILPNDKGALQGRNDAQKAIDASRVADLAKGFDGKVKAAEQLLNLQNYTQAAKLYNEAIKLQPSDPQVPVLQVKARYADAMARGTSALSVKNYPTAQASFDEALKAQPNDAQAQLGQQEVQKQLAAAKVAVDFDAKVKQADGLIKAMKYDQAGQVLTDAVGLLPGDARATALQPKIRYAAAMVRGQKAVSAKEYSDAVIAFSDALKEMPKDGPAADGLKAAQQQVSSANAARDFDSKVKNGDALADLGKYADASKAYSDALKLQPGNPQAAAVQTKARYTGSMAKAQVAVIMKKFDDALAAYKDALKVRPNDVAALQGQQDAQKQVQAASTAKDFDSRVKQADDLLAAGQKYDQASKLLSDAINLMPGDARVPILKGKIDFASSMVRGQAAMAKKQYADAAAEFKQATTLLPGNLVARKALQDAQEGIRLAQARVSFAGKIAEGDTHLKNQKYPEASKVLKEAILLLPNDPQVGAIKTQIRFADAMTTARTAMSVKSYQAAVNSFSEAVKISPRDLVAQQGLKDAQQQLQAASAAQTRQTFDAKLQQAKALFDQQRFAEANQLYNQAIQLIPNDMLVPTIQKRVQYGKEMTAGKADMDNKNYPNAITHFMGALNTMPGDPLASMRLQSAQQAQSAAAAAAKTRQDFNSKVFQANAAVDKHHYRDAHNLFNQAIGLIANDPSVPNLRKLAQFSDDMDKGLAAKNSKNFREAVRLFSAALQQKPGDPTATAELKFARSKVK